MEKTIERMEKTIEKMMRIVRANTGSSQLYADMLLSMLPGHSRKVNISYWCFKADRDDFETMLEIMRYHRTDLIFKYEELLLPYKEELENFKGSEARRY